MHLRTWTLGLAGVAAIPAVLLTAAAPTRPVPASHIQAPNKEVIRWHVESDPDGTLRAIATTTTESVSPYFDAVRLERVDGAGVANCGAFGQPRMSDNGSNRLWIYGRARGTSGVCAGRSAGSFVAVGTKGAVETRSEPVP
jgi:hypothetical protein